jgi:hypothetical protein
MRSVADATAAYEVGGYNAIVEGIVIPGWFYEPVRDRLHALGHPVAYAVLRAPLATCAARAEDRATQPLAHPEVVAQLWHQFADLGPLERHAIDIGTDGPEAAADQISRRLEDDSLTTCPRGRPVAAHASTAGRVRTTRTPAYAAIAAAVAM